MIVGSNTAESHIQSSQPSGKSAHKLNGQKLIAPTFREKRNGKTRRSFLHPKPSTDLVWLSVDQSFSARQRLGK